MASTINTSNDLGILPEARGNELILVSKLVYTTGWFSHVSLLMAQHRMYIGCGLKEVKQSKSFHTEPMSTCNQLILAL
jgi:hypothetical protein